MTSICWFRYDLRLEDNPAFTEAAKQGAVIPVFILDPEDRPLGGASKWWLHHSLEKLSEQLGGLVLFRGKPIEILRELVEKTEAEAVFWNRMYEPHAVKRDADIKKALKDDGLTAKSFRGSVIYEPWEIETNAGDPYKVYTPFWKSIKSKGFPEPLSKPDFELADIDDIGENPEELALLPKKPNWAEGWDELWQPGSEGAKEQLEEFLDKGLADYGEKRNRPDLPKVSRLSPHIHFGEISPRQICTAARFAADSDNSLEEDADKFCAEIAWRDFSNHLMFHFPEITERNWKETFDAYPWEDDQEGIEAWQKGMTGYPMVDAGMRELWHTGYMHNRVRMLAGSFLVKHLRVHWKEGEAWFWDTLVDADMANNNASWQWVAGSGADAAPYFRIFNPISQGPKFDPNGDYVRKWCPELADLPDSVLHSPFEASEEELEKAGVVLGETYPHPIVEHKKAREAALEGYEKVKQANAA